MSEDQHAAPDAGPDLADVITGSGNTLPTIATSSLYEPSALSEAERSFDGRAEAFGPTHETLEAAIRGRAAEDEEVGPIRTIELIQQKTAILAKEWRLISTPDAAVQKEKYDASLIARFASGYNPKGHRMEEYQTTEHGYDRAEGRAPHALHNQKFAPRALRNCRVRKLESTSMKGGFSAPEDSANAALIGGGLIGCSKIVQLAIRSQWSAHTLEANTQRQPSLPAYLDDIKQPKPSRLQKK